MEVDAMIHLTQCGFLPKCLIKANKVKCAAWQAGKAYIKPVDNTGKTVKQAIKDHGDLIHMDQAQSSTPGRPLTYSCKNNKNKVFYVTIFEDSVSKKVVC